MVLGCGPRQIYLDVINAMSIFNTETEKLQESYKLELNSLYAKMLYLKYNT